MRAILIIAPLLSSALLSSAPPAGAPTKPPPAAADEPTGAPPAEPAPDEGAVETPPAEPGETPAEPEPPAPAVDTAGVQRLQDEARSLRDDLFKARARVAVIASKLYKSKVTLQLKTNLERFYTASDLVLALDGAPVYQRDTGMPPTQGQLFEAFAAPGSHELSISASLVARRDPTYKVSIAQSFTIVVPEASTVSTKLVVRETGNMWRFSDRRRGRHDLRIVLRAKAKAIKSAKGKASVTVGAGAKK